MPATTSERIAQQPGPTAPDMTGRLAASAGPGGGPAKRDAVLAAGAAVFLEQGFGSASMDEVARRAQVSKATIYSYFAGKQALFGAIIGERCACMMPASVFADLAEYPPGETLAIIGRRFLDVILSPGALPLYRVVVSETARFPELGVAFYANGPGRVAAALADYFTVQHARGTLDIPDPRLAAEQFIGMIIGHLHIRTLLAVAQRPPEDVIGRVVASAVRIFINVTAVVHRAQEFPAV